MVKLLPAFFAVATFITAISFVAVEDNGKAGYTGSPGEVMCNTTNCHTGVAVNSQGGSVVISSPDLTDWVYVPGETYTIEVTVTQEGRGLFGLGFEALLSTNHNAGVLIPGTDSHIKTRTVNGVQRKNVVHQLNGGETQDFHTFTFTWEAPLSNEGIVTFYCSGNAANGNGLKTGDYIYNTSQVVTPLPDAIESNFIEKLEVNLFPNPAPETINIHYVLERSSQVVAYIISTDGKTSVEIFNELQPAGEMRKQFDLSDYANGIYMLKMSVNGIEQKTKLFTH